MLANAPHGGGLAEQIPIGAVLGKAQPVPVGPHDLTERRVGSSGTSGTSRADQPWQVRTLINLADVQRLTGDYAAAVVTARIAFDLLQQLDELPGQQPAPHPSSAMNDHRDAQHGAASADHDVRRWRPLDHRGAR